MHDHDDCKENFKYGLPERVKCKIIEILEAVPSAKPVQIRRLVRSKFPDLEISLSKVQGFVARQRSKVKDSFTENTIEGISTFIKANLYSDNIPENKLFVLSHKLEVEPMRSIVLMSTVNLLSLVVRMDEMYQTMILSMDGTYKLLWNEFPFIVVGAVDIMHRLHQNVFVFTSHEDENGFTFVLTTLKDWLMK